MAVALIALDAFLVLCVVPGLWLLAAWAAGALPYAGSARALRRRAAMTTTLVVLATVGTLARVGSVAGLASYGWWFVQEKVALALPLVLTPAVAALAVSLPRLARLRRAARADAESPAPLDGTLRRSAAEPAIAVPIQASAFGALAGIVVGFGTGYPARPVASLVLAGAVAAAAALTWWRHARRHARLADPAAPAGPRFGWRMLRGTGVVLASLLVLCGGGLLGGLTTRLPDRMAAGDHRATDLGGGTPMRHDHGTASGAPGGHSVSVDQLRGPRGTGPVRRFTLTAQEKKVRTPSGAVIDAWTFNGQLPGPELRVRQGDVVEVTLVNALPSEGATIHWHGYDVPNGEDGVAGVTQDAVQPGERFTYRFLAEDPGTYWYHSHELSSEAVARGLFGTLVVAPRDAAAPPAGFDATVPIHSFQMSGNVELFGASDRLTRHAVKPGTPVRLRVVNTDFSRQDVVLSGTPYRLVAVDGTDLSGPTAVTGRTLSLAAGGRYDLAFPMPDGPVLLSNPRFGGGEAGVLLSPDGGGALPAPATGPELDITRYGTPAATPFGRNSRFDRHFEMVLDEGFAFHDGKPSYAYTVNGRHFPDVPTQLVRYGELVKFTVVNRGLEDHPMHPHGHHVLVLSRNGKPITGSPLWMDTFTVRPGEVWEVAMKADNPGIWMDHCHNLWHARLGMVLHLAYDGVTSPYAVGRGTHNHPE